jgi:hypothetical protein
MKNIIKNLSKLEIFDKGSELSPQNVKDLFFAYQTYCKTKIDIYKKKKKKHRLPNFPEDISENIVKYIIKKKFDYCPLWDTKKGDLFYKGAQLEVKCFSSCGPSSFGPNESWDEIYFLDATNFLNDKFKCYKINLSNKDKKWKKIKVNSTQTYEDQCVQKRRPRISFKRIKAQLEDNIELIYSGSFDDIFC